MRKSPQGHLSHEDLCPVWPTDMIVGTPLLWLLSTRESVLLALFTLGIRCLESLLIGIIVPRLAYCDRFDHQLLYDLKR